MHYSNHQYNFCPQTGGRPPGWLCIIMKITDICLVIPTLIGYDIT